MIKNNGKFAAGINIRLLENYLFQRRNLISL